MGQSCRVIVQSPARKVGRNVGGHHGVAVSPTTSLQVITVGPGNVEHIHGGVGASGVRDVDHPAALRHTSVIKVDLVGD